VHKQHLDREKALGDILDALRTGYNPNYQDMAVLEAVRGWEFLAGLPHINDVGKDADSEESSDEIKGIGESETKEEEDLEPGMWTEGQLTYQLDELLNADHVSLLIEHDKQTAAPEVGSICEHCGSRTCAMFHHFQQCLTFPLICRRRFYLNTRLSEVH
jgi:protein kinase C substrate 80K-H